MRKIVIIILFVVICQLNAVDNDRTILLKQANRLRSRRQYEKVATIYSDWLKSHPRDNEVAGKLIENYLLMSKLEKSKEVFANYRGILAEEEIVKYEVLIALKQGEHKKAFQVATNFLEKHKNIGKYREIASLFEQYRSFEYAEKLMLLARKIAKDEFLYSRELANNYYSQEKYEASIREFFVMLERDEKYHYYASSRIGKMLENDQKLIYAVEEAVKNSTSSTAKTIYANALAKVGDYEKALDQYEYLPLKVLKDFASKLHSTGKNEVAKLAYIRYLNRSNDAIKQADVRVELARILIAENNLDEAKQYLMQVYNDEKIISRIYAKKTRANRFSRELLAEIALRNGESSKKILKLYDEAKSFCLSKRYEQEVEAKISNYILMSGNFVEAEKRIEKNYIVNPRDSEGYNANVLLDYLAAIMQDKPKADSLLGEVILNFAGNEKTNDALQLKVITDNLTEEAKGKFFLAYRNRNLYLIEEAVSLLEEVYSESKDETMLILAGEWLFYNGNLLDAERYFQKKFEDENLQEYASLRLAELNGDRLIVENFLREKPNSVFSAKFRKLYRE